MGREATITSAEAVFLKGQDRAVALAQKTDGTGVSPLLPEEQLPIDLTLSESRLLAALSTNPLAVVSKEDLLKAIWTNQNLKPLPQDHLIINHYISHLRKKLGDREDPQHPQTFKLIHTFEKRGVSLTQRLNIQPQDQTTEEELIRQKELGVKRRSIANGRELVLDDSRCLAYLFPEGREMYLSPNESGILATLMDQANKIVPDSYFKDLNISTPKGNVLHLRQKLKDSTIIQTRHLGYTLPSLDEDAKTDKFILRHPTAKGELVLDIQRQAFQAPHVKETVLLTPSETKLLAAFLKNPTQVLSLDDLSQNLWPDPDFEPQDVYSTIKGNLSHLRGKIRPVRIYGILRRGWSLTSTEEYVKAFLAKIKVQDENEKLRPNIKCFSNYKGDYYLITDRNTLILPDGQFTQLESQQTEIIEVLMKNPRQIFTYDNFGDKGIYAESLRVRIYEVKQLGLDIFCFPKQGYSLSPHVEERNGRHSSSSTIFKSSSYRS